ncbi:MAG TPA: isocitrate lyase/PEP mutase family protein [Elusimicrobiota bacterium]|nr:isocitrate lyase/PEP mutase family protein [Elusimicrobiota bacterium]
MKRLGPALKRRLARGGKLLRIGGAHSAFSARMLEEAGFPALWLSGFGVSATQFALPDANLVTLSESVEAAHRVCASVKIPVIVDADNGFGDAHNAERAVNGYGRAGAAGVCIEDSTFPKRCSLYSSAPRKLLPIPEMCEKLTAARRAADRHGMLLIGRVESLIADLGPRDAVARAQAYAGAGADAVLIHSRAFAPLAKIARSKAVRRPLVVVPTLFPDTPLSEISAAGFSGVIFANQLLRAMMKAGHELLNHMLKAKTLTELDPMLSTVDDVNRMVRVAPEWMREREDADGNWKTKGRA